MCYLRMVLFSLLPAALSCTDYGGYQPPKHMSAMVINAQCRWLWCSQCPQRIHSRPKPGLTRPSSEPSFLHYGGLAMILSLSATATTKQQPHGSVVLMAMGSPPTSLYATESWIGVQPPAGNSTMADTAIQYAPNFLK